MTIFLTTQYLEEADKLANEVAIINQGRIVVRGTPRDLKKEIGNQVVTLSFASAELAQRADAVLKGLSPQRQTVDSDLLCYFTAAADKLPGLIRALDEAQIPLEALTLNEPTLDDVFMRATGHRMAGAAAEEAS
jgi:ABC-2 type transport system ATP-binding protein